MNKPIAATPKFLGHELAVIEGHLYSLIFMFEPTTKEDGLRKSYEFHDKIEKICDKLRLDLTRTPDVKARMKIVLEECLDELKKESSL
jgi:hypothetical protein